MKNIILLIGVLFSISIGLGQEDCIPKGENNRFVYDFADMLSSSEEKTLTTKLKNFTDKTSNVLVVITQNDLCGFDIAQYAIEFGDKTGFGREDKENGIVMLIKPKTSSEKGRISIAVGTGLQGAITDAGTRRIIDYEIIPYFKQGRFIGGINAGAEILMRLATSEISEADYMAKSESEGMWIVLILLVIFIVIFILAQKYGDGGDDWENYDRHGKHRGRRGGGMPWIIIGGGGGSRGGGGFGGGGFGGIGGGGFSGGGASGSW